MVEGTAEAEPTSEEAGVGGTTEVEPASTHGWGTADAEPTRVDAQRLSQ